MKKRPFFALCLLIATLFASLVSCSEAERQIVPLAEKFSDLYGSLPAGSLYASKAAEWEEGYFSPELASVLFGDDPNEAVDGSLDFCVYLGSSRDAVAEFGIFICESRSDAETVSELCLYRLMTLRSPTYGTVDVSALDASFVKIGGKVVVYSVLPDAASAHRAADGVLD